MPIKNEEKEYIDILPLVLVVIVSLYVLIK